jgi:thioredoxin reductase
MVEVAIIGAGPYGLSIAAHLKPLGLDFRIFGEPMNTWQEHMPKGMRLKSEGFASSLYDPDSAFTLAQYCKEKGLPYADVGLPVPLETFISYGLEFQKRFVPELENKRVVSIARCPSGFQIRLADGEVVVARKVVNAVGLSHFAFVPPILSDLPGELATHSSAHSILDRFKGAEVAVVGGGSSAVDLAALLHEAGASVHLVARKPTLRFHDRGQFPRPLLQRIQNPMTGLGPGWKSKFCTDAPLLFRSLPEAFRLKFVRKHLGPSTAWFVKDQVVGKVPFHLGVTVTRASVENHRANLELMDGSGARRNLTADHVVAGTGYKVDLRRLTFLDSGLVAGIRSVEQTPVLSSNFESSVPGLYFVGASAANSFGPLLRFAFGAGFTAQRLSRHLARSASNGA